MTKNYFLVYYSLTQNINNLLMGFLTIMLKIDINRHLKVNFEPILKSILCEFSQVLVIFCQGAKDFAVAEMVRC